jgi:hypothetical protein
MNNTKLAIIVVTFLTLSVVAFLIIQPNIAVKAKSNNVLGHNHFQLLNKDVSTLHFPLIQPTKPVDTADLVADIIKGSVQDEQKARRDVGALLAWLKAVKPNDVEILLSNVNEKVANDATALALLEKIKTDLIQLPANAPFGRVLASEPLATERLALLARITQLLSFTKVRAFYQAITDFAASSGTNAKSFAVAKQVQEKLGTETITGGIWWRSEIIPVLLQSEWENTQLISAATGGELPDQWKEAT